MNSRNLKKELLYSVYYDMENGNDTETIDYESLINLLGELLDRVEKLETSLKTKPQYASLPLSYD